jgi:hypothetical protein
MYSNYLINYFLFAFIMSKEYHIRKPENNEHRILIVGR